MASSMLLLLVEDEVLIRDMMEDVLTDSGYDVVKADNGNDALNEIETDASRFRAVVTDI